METKVEQLDKPITVGRQNYYKAKAESINKLLAEFGADEISEVISYLSPELRDIIADFVLANMIDGGQMAEVLERIANIEREIR